jgi:hypothetical protein
VWECELPSLAAVDDAMAAMGHNPDHGRLLKRQVPFFLEAWTEVYEVLDFPAPRAGRRARRRRLS